MASLRDNDAMIKITLRQLILLLALSMALLTLGYTLYASYQTQRDLLMQLELENNYAYATKLASSTDNFLAAAQQQLAFSANLLPPLMAHPASLVAETERLKRQTNSFNSVVVIRPDGHILASSPASLHLTGTWLDSAGFREALAKRKPLISPPYIASTGRLVIFISHPLFARNGRYLGYLGGTIYLHEQNILQSLLGENHYRDGSYLYVVDNKRRLIYHRDTARVGTVVNGNPAIEAVIAGRAGSQRLINSRHVDMLAGYAPMHLTQWGIVAQRPTADTLDGLNALMLSIIRHAAPFFLLSVLGVWWISRVIAQPLSRLAATARDWDSPAATEEINQVRAWYDEADKLKRAVLAGLGRINQKLGRLNVENVTDELTGLINRRGMQATLAQWQAELRPFAVIAMDIDHFKWVNDRHGHDVGDLVLQYLARQMCEGSRSDDQVCRSGGEEFCMLLPGCSLDMAIQIAERLRERIAATNCPTGEPVTLSLGVAHWPGSAGTVTAVLKAADEALYLAKHNGRNRVEMAATEK